MDRLDRRSCAGGGLLVIDMQEKLLAALGNPPAVEGNCVRLMRGAKLLKMPVWVTEQYPRGLGPTIGPVRAEVERTFEKLTFSSCGVGELIEQLHGRSIRHVTLAGIETHVCVLQTALELMQLGFAVQVAADATASRSTDDARVALGRLEQAGAVITTTETQLFEWIGTADHAAFKAVSGLVKAGPIEPALRSGARA